MALAMFIVAGTNGISGLIPDGYLGFVEAFMTFLTMYFKLNPSQNYN